MIGATNVGLTLLGFNVIEMIANAVTPMLATISYAAIGISGVKELYDYFKK